MNKDIHLLSKAYSLIREQTMDSLPKLGVGSSQPQLTGFISTTTRGGIDLNEQILFEFDKAILTSKGKEVLRGIAQKIVEFQKTKGMPEQIKILGYTDLYGGTSYNQQLSMSRANAVAEELKRNGVQTPISTAPMGMKNPKVQLKYDLVNGKAPQQGIDQQQPNRRVEIEFNPPLPELTRRITQIPVPNSIGPGPQQPQIINSITNKGITEVDPETQKAWLNWAKQRNPRLYQQYLKELGQTR